MVFRLFYESFQNGSFGVPMEVSLYSIDNFRFYVLELHDQRQRFPYAPHVFDLKTAVTRYELAIAKGVGPLNLPWTRCPWWRK